MLPRRLALVTAALQVLLFLAASRAHAQPVAVQAQPEASAEAWTAPDGRTVDQLIADHVLPDPATTPGVANPDVTPDTIKATICVHGWTAKVRPPASYTNRLKLQALPAGFKMSDCEEDHLWSIEDGGHPRDPRNLWCMKYDDIYGARVKDVLETFLAHQVCAGEMTLDEARAALTPNWIQGYETHIGLLPTGQVDGR